MTRTIAATTAAAMIWMGMNVAASTPEQTPWSAQTSDPQAMGWMQGFPPAKDQTIRFTDVDYFAFPKLRWTACHFRELMPTVGVRNGASGATALPVALDPAIDDIEFMPLGANQPMTWKAAFDANYSDGVLVLHQGRIVYERYAGCLGPHTLHGAMSVTKSITGLLGEILVAEGQLDDSVKVGTLISELENSAFGDASVREVMDMTTGLDYSEDYADPNAEVWTYAKAGSPLPPPADYTGPRSYFDYLETVKKQGTHGAAFGYKTVNADVLGWLIARTTGKSVADELSDAIWTQIGAEREAFYTVDSIGTPFAGGGFNATLRDMGRLGLLLLNEGRWQGEQIIPAKAIENIRGGGNKQAFAQSGYSLLKGWSYRAMWWVSHDDHGAFAARGVHGQTIWIDPKAQMVIVRFASHPVAANGANDPTSLPAYRAVADYLITHDPTHALTGDEWVIEDISGHGVIDNSHASLQFLAEEQLAGSGGCNRLLGSYAADGDKLSIKPAGTTMMACPEALMNQERTLLALLPQITRYAIDENGSLLLTTDSGQTITARRP